MTGKGVKNNPIPAERSLYDSMSFETSCCFSSIASKVYTQSDDVSMTNDDDISTILAFTWLNLTAAKTSLKKRHWKMLL
jgi:hypothetical protein